MNTVSRVATDLENLVKFREFERDLCKSRNLPKTVTRREGLICDRILEFCCLKFIFSQAEDPSFENGLGEHAPISLKWP